MILYLFKSILCSTVFLLVYLLLLEKEKMHRFNRWYLLGSMVSSLLIPLISFSIQPETLPALQNVQETYYEIVRLAEKTSAASVVTQKTETHYLTIVLWALYSLVSIGLFIRFFRNMYALLLQTAKNTIVPYNSAKLVLLKENVVSHTFLQYIFISEADFNSHKIEEEILLHELTHVKEKHSWDILFVELIHSIFWFNPLFIFYKKAIQLNHEFLADDAVVRKSTNVQSYQYLLLDKVSLGNQTYLTSPFNFSVTKKRLVMMTRKINPARILIKKIILQPLLVILIFVFGSRIIIAQNKQVPLENQTKTDTVPQLAKKYIMVTPDRKLPAKPDGISDEQIREYNTIINRNLTTVKGRQMIRSIPDQDRKKLESLFLSMNESQQNEARVYFIRRGNPWGKEIPTEAQIGKWKNPSDYGVWIDDKKILNEDLNKYKASDFSHYSASNLNYNEKMKQDVMQRFNLKVMYKVQLNLMTNAYYDKYYKGAMEEIKKNPNEMLYRFDGRGSMFVN